MKFHKKKKIKGPILIMNNYDFEYPKKVDKIITLKGSLKNVPEKCWNIIQ